MAAESALRFCPAAFATSSGCLGSISSISTCIISEATVHRRHGASAGHGHQIGKRYDGMHMIEAC